MNKISTASDWWGVNGVEAMLRHNISNLKPGLKTDLLTMIDACDHLVHDLNLEEIECRRRHTQTKRHAELGATINNRVDYIDQMITLGTLMS